MSKSSFKKGAVFGKWILQRFINAGGNGEVWVAQEKNNKANMVAIKLLKGIKHKSYKRFKIEVNILCENSDIKGLMPIIDYSLPEFGSGTPWYTMPIGIPLSEHLDNKGSEAAIDAIIDVTKILAVLHSRKISHRDIKPENILLIDNDIYLSDFGLVDFEGKKNLTKDEKQVGAVWTIAPEMRRYPADADGMMADVYSLAKALWILITRENKGFEGQYTTNPSIALIKYDSSIYQGTLNRLLHNSTEHDPSMRPDIQQFLTMLNEWKKINNDPKVRAKAEWADIKERLFIKNTPDTVVWEAVDDIIYVLNVISECKGRNHTLFPNGGGLDLEGSKESWEEGCIELTFNGSAYIVKPNKLHFENFFANTDWSYFRLETEGLELIGTYETDIQSEGLTEIKPCVYSDYECYEYNDFNGEKLPDTARTVVRVKQGAFMICLNVGIYNSIPETYDGRHNKFTAFEFRKYIEKTISQLERDNEKVKVPVTQTRSPELIHSTKIRRGSRFLSTDEISEINRIIALAEDASKECDEISQEVGMDNEVSNFFDESSIKAFIQYENTPKPKKKAFYEYVSSLSDDVLALTEAVMYGGRDASYSGRAHPLDEMLEQFSNDSRDSRIHAITGKRDSLSEYLRCGIESYK